MSLLSLRFRHHASIVPVSARTAEDPTGMSSLVPAPGRITTHVLDTAAGVPGAALSLTLHRIENGTRELLGRFVTNGDGRCDRPLLEGAAMRAGVYELTFHVGDWRNGTPGFYDEIPIRFRVSDPHAHHHVPLILSPFGYSTYRGS
jgi:5-hydroxyisourate hydrolase